ncbi:conserved protein of unknown function [Sterolibacterium denitrificans]|uniref:DUF1841 domain-containing protein n=1 Tax=Sterolibacterium denitrificans TaxID=157592 RepID=A0A7Z7HQC2_9PROT|nr:DUF1841 family protein [Sterolibacterium denitrificans]SMB24803.1 conserved protein of unknown function [Sterolibacterium denitrificans]
MFNPSRDQARRFFIEAWHKRQQGLPMTQLELIAADLVSLHPEYHALLGDAQNAQADIDALLAREWTPEQGEANPFLHLSLHLAIEEQLSIDQPPGIRRLFEQLSRQHGERHAALHDVLECLGETVWRAQRDRAAPDGAAYLDCMRRKIRAAV